MPMKAYVELMCCFTIQGNTLSKVVIVTQILGILIAVPYRTQRPDVLVIEQGSMYSHLYIAQYLFIFNMRCYKGDYREKKSKNIIQNLLFCYYCNKNYIPTYMLYSVFPNSRTKNCLFFVRTFLFVVYLLPYCISLYSIIIILYNMVKEMTALEHEHLATRCTLLQSLNITQQKADMLPVCIIFLFSIQPTGISLILCICGHQGKINYSFFLIM